MSEFSPLRGGNEGEGELLRRSKRSRPGAYGACNDEEQEKALALLLRLGGHFRPQCGRFQGLELALFRPTRFEIGAVFLKSRLNPRCDRLSGGADAIKRGF